MKWVCRSWVGWAGRREGGREEERERRKLGWGSIAFSSIISLGDRQQRFECTHNDWIGRRTKTDRCRHNHQQQKLRTRCPPSAVLYSAQTHRAAAGWVFGWWEMWKPSVAVEPAKWKQLCSSSVGCSSFSCRSLSSSPRILSDSELKVFESTEWIIVI